MKPKPAPKPALSVAVLSVSPTPDLVSSEAAQAVPDPPALSAPTVAPPIPMNPAAPTAAADPAPPDAPVLDEPIVAAAPAGAVASQPVVSATTDGPGQVAVSVAPAPPTVPPLVQTPAVQAVRGPAPLAAAPPAPRPPSPCSRQHRPHSLAPRDERERSRRRHDSPRHRGSQANWAASRGGRGGWWGGRGRGGDWGYDRPVSMANLQRAVSAAVREERNGQASQSNSPRVAPTHASLPPAAPYAPAPPFPQSAVPPPHAPFASAAALGNRMCLPWVPPVAGMEFVTAEGGPQSLVGPSPTAVVPEASLGQLWRLSEGLKAVHLIQVYGHAALAQGVPLESGHRDECLDAADRLGELLAPVLAAPTRGGVAGVGQLGTAVHGLRRFLCAGTAVDLIGATTVVVRELHRSLTGLLAVLDADQM
ncbi:unnamed protein product [Closterium sp. Naga37s-1]|nr:unnamed protein product [Closterium sp. Naga37s-1]